MSLLAAGVSKTAAAPLERAKLILQCQGERSSAASFLLAARTAATPDRAETLLTATSGSNIGNSSKLFKGLADVLTRVRACNNVQDRC